MNQIEDFGLRELEQKDREIILKWRNSDRIRDVMFTDQIISVTEHQNWFNKVIQESPSLYRIFEFQHRPIGFVSFNQFDKRNNKSFWGFYIGETDTPPKSGIILGYLALEYAFGILGICKLCSEVFAFNIPSIKFHNKFGFVQEGGFVKHVLKNGKYEDVVAMALFQEDWAKMRSKLELLL